MRKPRNPKYLKKNLGKPLTETEVIRINKLINMGEVKGELHKFRGNFYFIPEKNV